jgi:hypothetical protein
VTSSDVTYIETLCFSPEQLILEPDEAWYRICGIFIFRTVKCMLCRSNLVKCVHFRGV